MATVAHQIVQAQCVLLALPVDTHRERIRSLQGFLEGARGVMKGWVGREEAQQQEVQL